MFDFFFMLSSDINTESITFIIRFVYSAHGRFFMGFLFFIGEANQSGG